MTFEVKGNQFIKDGKEIKIISGAVHYFRNMPDTWRDIFKKLRAIGCTTFAKINTRARAAVDSCFFLKI